MSFEQICYDRKVSHNCGSQPLPRTPQSPHKVAGWSRATAGPALTFARAHAGPLSVSAGDKAASRCHCGTARAVPIALLACPVPSQSLAWCPTSKQSPGLVGAGSASFLVPARCSPAQGAGACVQGRWLVLPARHMLQPHSSPQPPAPHSSPQPQPCP